MCGRIRRISAAAVRPSVPQRAVISVGEMVAPDTIRVAYALLITIWSWPIQMVLAIATWRHAGRVAAAGGDRAWALPETKASMHARATRDPNRH